VTLKSTLRVTQGHWKRNRWTDHTRLTIELLDVEYYRDLEMWVRGHSRSLKVVPFESLGMIYYLLKAPFSMTLTPNPRVRVRIRKRTWT